MRSRPQSTSLEFSLNNKARVEEDETIFIFSSSVTALRPTDGLKIKQITKPLNEWIPELKWNIIEYQ